MATDLIDAAGRSFDNLFVKWQTNLISNALIGFINDLQPVFNDTVANDRTVGNWITILRALQSQLPFGLTQPSLTFVNQAAIIVYQICWAAQAMSTQGLISGAQAADVLASYNAFIE